MVRSEEVEKQRFEVRVGVMFGEVEAVALVLWLGVPVEERSFEVKLEGLKVVSLLAVASSLLVSPSLPLSFSSPLVSAPAPPKAALSGLSPKASPHPPFSSFLLSTSFLSLLPLPCFPSLPCF